MPRLKRCSVEKEEITGGNDVEESFSAAVNSKKLKRYTDDSFTDPVNHLGGHSTNFSNDRPRTGDAFCNGEANSATRRVVERKPPLLKSSRGRRQALPVKFSDSVLHSWKNEKSDCSDNPRRCSADNNEYVHDVSYNKKLTRPESDGTYDDIYLVKKPRIDNQVPFLLRNVILEPYSTSKSAVASANEGTSSVNPVKESGVKMNGYAGERKPVEEKAVERKADFYKPGDFVTGDIVWAKCGKNFPAWPAIVIDPPSQAPEAVLRAYVPDTICVMFYGYSRSGQRVIFFATSACMHVYVIYNILGVLGLKYSYKKMRNFMNMGSCCNFLIFIPVIIIAGLGPCEDLTFHAYVINASIGWSYL